MAVLTKDQWQALSAQIDAEAARSGLSKPAYYTQLSQAHDPRLALLNGYVPQDAASLNWLERNLPWLIPAGGFAASSLLGAGGGGAATGGADASSTVTPITDISTAPAFGATDAGVMAGTTLPAAGAGTSAAVDAASASQTIKNSLTKQFTTPQGLAQLAALIPTLHTLAGSGENPNNPFNANSPLMAEVQRSIQMGNDRTAKASPIYDAVVNQAYGRTPTRYRGAAPSGYPAGGDAAPAGAYTFQAPQFGGR